MLTFGDEMIISNILSRLIAKFVCLLDEIIQVSRIPDPYSLSSNYVVSLHQYKSYIVRENHLNHLLVLSPPDTSNIGNGRVLMRKSHACGSSSSSSNAFIIAFELMNQYENANVRMY